MSTWDQDEALMMYINAEEELKKALQAFNEDKIQEAATHSRLASSLLTDIWRAEGKPEEIRKRIQAVKQDPFATRTV